MSIFEQVISLSRHVQPIAPVEVDELERHLGFPLPVGYRAFITRFGVGSYCDLYRIYPPAEIMKRYPEQREYWKNWYFDDSHSGARRWFFEGSESILSEEQLQQSIIIGDSFDGDQLVFYPPEPETIFILPRHSRTIERVKADFSDLHLWDHDSPRVLIFEPWEHQTTLYFHSREFSIDKDGFLEQIQARWGSDSVIMHDDAEDEWSWLLICYIRVNGARLQIDEDENVPRTYTNKNGGTVTRRGSGNRHLNVRVDCDEEVAPDIEAFIASLSAHGVQFERREFK